MKKPRRTRSRIFSEDLTTGIRATDMKTLRISIAASLLLISARASAAPLKITIVSDSTACYFAPSDTGGRWGWGMAFPDFFTTNIVVTNLAASGRSSKSFYDEGKWANALTTQANYYFIQFAHNDSNTSDPTRY